MVPEDLLFWMSPIDSAPVGDANLLCRRHADAMVVPRGWTLDDRRDETLRLFRPKEPSADAESTPPRARRRRPRAGGSEQLQIDGTGEIERPVEPDVQHDEPGDQPVDDPTSDAAESWQPDFDAADDLDGLLEVSSPLLARAFRGTDRPKR